MDRPQHGSQLVAERVAHGLDGVGDEGDLAAQTAGHRGGLGADETTADHDQVWLSGQVLAQGDGVLQGAQDVHPTHPVGAGQTAGPGAGGHHQRVVTHEAAIGQGDLPVLDVQRDGRRAQTQPKTEGFDVVRTA